MYENQKYSDYLCSPLDHEKKFRAIFVMAIRPGTPHLITGRIWSTLVGSGWVWLRDPNYKANLKQRVERGFQFCEEKGKEQSKAAYFGCSHLQLHTAETLDMPKSKRDRPGQNSSSLTLTASIVWKPLLLLVWEAAVREFCSRRRGFRVF